MARRLATPNAYYEAANKVVTKYWAGMEPDFRAMNLDHEDVCQDVAHEVQITLVNYVDLSPRQLMSKVLCAARWKILKLHRAAQSYRYRYIKLARPLDELDFSDASQPASAEEPCIPDETSPLELSLIWLELEEFLTPTERRLLDLRVTQKCTYDEIALTLFPGRTCSEQYAQRLGRNLLTKLQKFLTKRQKFS